MCISVVVPGFLELPTGMTADFLDRETLRRMTAEAKYDLTAEFLDDALAKGGEGYAIVDGAEPAAYGWYAHSATRMSDGMLVQFDPAYVYMYKGLTLDAYRGRRLHAIGMTRALAAYRAQGFKGLVSYIESDNLNSLKSAYRIGYVDFGRVFIIRMWDRLVAAPDDGAAFVQARGTARHEPPFRPGRVGGRAGAGLRSRGRKKSARRRHGGAAHRAERARGRPLTTTTSRQRWTSSSEQPSHPLEHPVPHRARQSAGVGVLAARVVGGD